MDKLTDILYRDIDKEVLEKMPKWFRLMKKAFDERLNRDQ